MFDDAGRMDNGKSVQLLTDLSLLYAKAGFDVIAPSDMMDGRIGSIRRTLNDNALEHIDILSYSSKFESCFYGPFRDAAGRMAMIVCRDC